MSSATPALMNNDSTVFGYPEIQDVSSWFLMGSPYPVLGIVLAYLYFVISFGPNMMRSKPAYSLQRVIVGYNAFLVGYNLWLLVEIIKVDVISYLTTSWCTSVHNTDYRSLATALPNLCWWYFFSKVIELLDTVLFVLRKKDGQVTFLHLYHHASMTLCTWLHLKYHQGEQAFIIGLANCFVHVIMYSYYLVAALGPKYQKYIWWKKYLTWMQLTQFCFVLYYHFALLAYDCELSKYLTYCFMANTSIFLTLFSIFYKSAYSSKPKKNVYDINKNK